MAKKIGIGILIAAVFGALLHVAVYLLASHSDAFKLVEQTLRNSQALQSQVGHVERVRLAPFGDNGWATAGDNGWATMTVEVTGATKTVTLDVKTKKTNSVWAIEQASLDGKPVVLN